MKIIILKIILDITFLPPICNRGKKKIRKSCSSLLGAKPKLRLFCWQAGISLIMYVIEHVLHWNIIYIMFSNPSGMMYKNTMLVQLLKGHQKTSVDILFITTAEEEKSHLCPKLLMTSVLPTSQWYSCFFSSSPISLAQNLVSIFPSLFFNYQFISLFLILSSNAQSLSLEFLFPFLLKPLLFLCNGSENCNSQFPTLVFSLFSN